MSYQKFWSLNLFIIKANYDQHFVLQSVQDTGEQLMAESDLMNDDIKLRLKKLAENWEELKGMTSDRGQKLDESLAYQQFAASLEEEEAWITGKY